MNTKELLVGAGMGAAIVYLFDPADGRRRRALARDRMIRAARTTRDGLTVATRDLANRTKGIAAATRGRLAPEEVDDGRIAERVRAKLGRVCSHPRAIEVEVLDGRVTLRGPILAREVDAVLRAVAAVRGVRSVDNALEPHETAGSIPSLQGEGRAGGPKLDILQRNWAPATQALVLTGVAATGTYVARYARRH